MSAFLKHFNPVSYSIIIAQYKHDEYSIGDEGHLHWVLIVITDTRKLGGPCFKAVDRLYSDGREKIWKPHYTEDSSLLRMTECLGGIQIGAIKARKLDSLIKIVGGHDTVPTFEDGTAETGF